MGKTALVTGAARGIGRAIAEKLAADGFTVVATDLAPPDETARAIRAAGGTAHALEADIAALDRHAEVLDAAERLAGPLDCLVNNAGISVKVRGDLLDVTPESFDALLAVNLRGTFFLTQAAARRMVARPDPGYRSIITISSANAAMASVDRGEYCLTKSALPMLSRLFALRLADAGIRVFEIRPGVITTAMTAVAKERYDAKFQAGFTPINRWGQADEVAQAAAMLASGALPYTTGEVLHVDGGLAIGRF